MWTKLAFEYNRATSASGPFLPFEINLIAAMQLSHCGHSRRCGNLK